MTHYTLHDGIAVVTLDRPPVNSLSHALRSFIVPLVSTTAAQALPAGA